MKKPMLLWLNLCVAEKAEPPAVFAERFHVVPGDVGALAGQGGLEAAVGPETPDVLCFEFDYPDMSGLQWVPEAKRLWPSVPVLMLTTQHSADLALWALRARVYDYLVKPLVAEDVERCMSQLGRALEARRRQFGRSVAADVARPPREARYRPVRTERPLLPALSHVTRHLGAPITLATVAGLCGMSTSRFSREFKSAFGTTFQEYLRDARLAEARRLLSNPAVPIGDVAAMIGFTDASYFARLFRRYVGYTPTEFRRLTAGAPGSREGGIDPAVILIAAG